MTKQVIINVIVEPFWVWTFLLITIGFIAVLFGMALAWFFQPRYVYFNGYNVVGGRKCLPERTARKPRKATILQKLLEFRKKFQPVERRELPCDWSEGPKFSKPWHHARYRGILMRKHGVKLPRGPITVWKRGGKFAVYHQGTYYIIHWK